MITDKLLKVKTILVTQPKPESDKNPYSDLASKYNLKIDFRPFIHVEGVEAKDFRREKINLADFTAVILTSRTGIDQYFRLCEEMRFEVSPELKYFCNTESTALYLQKYIQYRKRKIFFPKNTGEDLFSILRKHATEKFLFPCSDVHKEDVPTQMREAGYDVTDAIMYRTVVSDLSDLADVKYDVLVFFSPSAIKSLFANFPDFVQNSTLIAAFGSTTQEAVDENNLRLDIAAPKPESPSMTMAIEEYIREANKG